VGLRSGEINDELEIALYQGTASAVPQAANNSTGFSPGAAAAKAVSSVTVHRHD